MNYNTLEDALEQVELPLEIEAWSVYRAFEQVQDGGDKRGGRYSMALLLTRMVWAKLAGMTTLAAIADWVRRLSRLVKPGAAQSAQELSVRGHLQ